MTEHVLSRRSSTPPLQLGPLIVGPMSAALRRARRLAAARACRPDQAWGRSEVLMMSDHLLRDIGLRRMDICYGDVRDSDAMRGRPVEDNSEGGSR